MKKKPTHSTITGQPRRVTARKEASSRKENRLVRKTATKKVKRFFTFAAPYLRRGFSVVPQLAGAKKPLVRWKPFQKKLPTLDELGQWNQCWPDAGPAIVLGTVSGLLVIDVDGSEARDALVAKLGEIPLAPKVLSGSGDPNRFHLYFRHPLGLDTRSKFCPWHPKLEFRGNKGIVIAPPAIHKSGRRYRWAPQLSLDDLDPPPLPDAVLAALQESPKRKKMPHVPVVLNGRQRHQISAVEGIAQATREFLLGRWANRAGWNSRLFAAACDLRGIGMSYERASALLLAGAHPWTSADHDQAVRTIDSAFSQERLPARALASTQKRRATRLRRSRY